MAGDLRVDVGPFVAIDRVLVLGARRRPPAHRGDLLGVPPPPLGLRGAVGRRHRRSLLCAFHPFPRTAHLALPPFLARTTSRLAASRSQAPRRGAGLPLW